MRSSFVDFQSPKVVLDLASVDRASIAIDGGIYNNGKGICYYPKRGYFTCISDGSVVIWRAPDGIKCLAVSLSHSDDPTRLALVFERVQGFCQGDRIMQKKVLSLATITL